VSSTSVIGLFLYLLSRCLLLKGCADISLLELYDPVTIMFFFRNKHMMCDFGTGNNNKLNWVLEDKQELIDIIETIYRGAKKGRGLVVSPKDYSTRYRY
jgi:DIM1 family U5 snRNP protein